MKEHLPFTRTNGKTGELKTSGKGAESGAISTFLTSQRRKYSMLNMGKLLYVITGFIIGIVTAWFVLDNKMNAQLRQAHSEADQRVAASQKQLIEKQNEVALFKTHNVELSKRAQDLQKQVDQPLPTPVPAVEKAAKEENPFMTMFGPDQMKAMTRNHLEARLASLKTRLKLTDAQLSEMTPALQREVDAAAKFRFDGKSDPNAAPTPSGPGFEETLKKVMTPQQQEGYKQYQADEKQNTSEMMANSELMQLQQATMSLTEQQKDLAFQAFTKEAQLMMDPKFQASAASDVGNFNPNTIIEQQMQRKREALRGILTPEQFASYEKQLAVQLEMQNKMLQNMKFPTPSRSTK